MKSIGLIFPHQLFKKNPIIKTCNEVYLLEDSLYFGDKYNLLKFHKQKLVFHRASMKKYAQELETQGLVVHYIEYNKEKTIMEILPELDNNKIVVVDPTDYLLERRLRRRFKERLTLLKSPLFINSKEDNQNYLKDGKLFMQEFYKYQRKRLNILMDNEGPAGGKWSFDDENRKKIPKAYYPEIPADSTHQEDVEILEAIRYVEEKFPENPGNTQTFSYATDSMGAEKILQHFCKERLHLFGDYEDAIVKDSSQLYHSILSPYLNSGLLEPLEVVHTILRYAQKNDISLNSTEGFVRQIIGWREFIRMVYEEHSVSMRKKNEWKHSNKLDESWYQGSTGLTPVDQTIKKTLNTAYAHHIERLMILGNAMFLCNIHPDEVYCWFMEMYIDAYDWVMVPNVYGMTQSTQKGLMTTKPYISGSNYIKKMSDYSTGEWADIWDALYWDTIITNLDELMKNGRMHFVTARAKKFTLEQKQDYVKKAKAFRSSYKKI
ncbi:MAG: deoxyribodipyrimidine photolyase-related protein [Flavobacteriaceae bacterium]|jgi:deoxyribodipyrimidine photolyase-related protein